MAIECTVVCLDNTDYMRNEDYLPSRMMAVCEAVDFIVQSKLRSHPENHVALVTFSNNEVVSSLSTNHTKLFMDMRKVKVGGSMKFCQSLNVAHLVLKHRPVKTHKCRIIAIVGSPLDVTDEKIQPVGKKFKKENVIVDVISFGEEPGLSELEQLVGIINGPNGKSSTLTTVPRGISLLTGMASSGPWGRSSGSGRDHLADEDDEELMMALAMSMRETDQTTTIPPSVVPSGPPLGIQDGNALSDEEQLSLALQLSLQEEQEQQAKAQEITNNQTATSDVPALTKQTIQTESNKEGGTTSSSPNGGTSDGGRSHKQESRARGTSASKSVPKKADNNKPNPPPKK